VITPTHFRADAEGRFRANPEPGTRLEVIASSPDGQPYVSARKWLEWPKGAVEQSVDIALPRGVLIRGKVIEQGDGRPVAGAALKYEITAKSGEDRSGWSRVAATSADGSFTIAVPPKPGHLIVRGPADDYVPRAFGSDLLYAGTTGGARHYAHALTACDPKPGGDRPDVVVKLQRGATVRGRLIAADGRPAPDSWVFSRVILSPIPLVYRLWRAGSRVDAREGRFELHGLDPVAEVPVYFLEPKGPSGATAMLPGRCGTDGPVTVRLEPCGAAWARLVGPDGQPVPGFRDRQLITMVVTPGPSRGTTSGQPGQLMADEGGLFDIDPIHYGNPPTSDGEGRIAFPVLIPGATYRVRTSNRNRRPLFQKDFTVQPGETLILGNIPVDPTTPPR
jgi:hypothetical protein